MNKDILNTINEEFTLLDVLPELSPEFLECIRKQRENKSNERKCFTHHNIKSM